MSKRANIFSSICIVFASLLFFGQSAEACTCMRSGAVDEEYAQSANVIVLKVTAVEKYASDEKGYGYGGIKQSKLIVEKVYKGNLKINQELSIMQGGGADCIWTFDEKSVGQKYLFYLGAKPLDQKSAARTISATTFGNPKFSPNIWVASTCSRSGGIEYRAGDIKYLDNVPQLQGKTRLSGTVSQWKDSAVEEVLSEYKMLAGRNIRVVGNGKSTLLKTDNNGVYEVYDLSPGKYQVSVEPIAGYKTTTFDDPKEIKIIEVKAQHHTELDFTYYIDNSISGRFFNADGKALKDVCLELLPSQGKKEKYFHNFDCTDENGLFKLTSIPVGKYLIVVNDDNEISADEPFGMFYYPKTTKREEAKEISISAGEHLKNINITAPNSKEVVTISGTVLFENSVAKQKDGYEYVSVEFVPDKNDKSKGIDGKSRVTVKTDGSFSLRILKGQKGKIYAELLTFSGDRLNCPKLEKILKAQGERSMDVKTNSIIAETTKNSDGVVLKFPFPDCKKVKID